jgi:hypothetical protein
MVRGKIVIDGARILLDKTYALFTHAPSVMLHYAVDLDEEADSVRLAKPEDKKTPMFNALTHARPYTEGGTVIFRIKRTSK